ncbi:MAG: UvrD-helicase domain-containing protein, partial [Candidatus Dadabacteria bacterium]|nr:UvrD-helicase domain-containing protein [Candidatus Dadabacteria bacterium]
ELETLAKQLDSFSDDERFKYRNKNASSIAQHTASKILIVSGPGTGKSYLFLQRLKNWLEQDPQGKIFVTSFVRKLVADLHNEIDNDQSLSDKINKQITVSTLHKHARSILEKNKGARAWHFKRFIQIISYPWDRIIWNDVLNFYPDLNRAEYSLKKFEHQLHDNRFEDADKWKNLKLTYWRLCKFYNAVGFADLIIRANVALQENPKLNGNNYFIIDEYQDFNLAEDELINLLVHHSKGILMVGDDEQVLYETLKLGKSELIRTHYRNTNFVNCMLPYCTRSLFHISKAASHFIQQHRDTDTIEKIYLPLKTNDKGPEVKIIGCAGPEAAVDYIKKFVTKNKAEIDERKEKLDKGEPEDAFLLILTPEDNLNIFGKPKTIEIFENILREYKSETHSFCEDYLKLSSYCLLAENPENNYTFRKVLHYEDMSEDEVHQLIDFALKNVINLKDINSTDIEDILNKCLDIKKIINEKGNKIQELLSEIRSYIPISDIENLKVDLERKPINNKNIVTLESIEEEDDEVEAKELNTKKMDAIEFMTLVRSKGLSADHVIIVGFDNRNMSKLTKNAFYVGLTRARESLHLITAMKSRGSRSVHKFLDQLPEEHLEFCSYKKQGRTLDVLKGKKEFIRCLKRWNSWPNKKTKK